MEGRGPTRRELLTGLTVVTAAGLGVVGSRSEQSDAAAAAARAAADAEPYRGTPLGIRRVIWSVPNDAALVGLTFDDGPTTRYTPKVLEALREAKVTATFNVVGVRALQEPGLLREIVAGGHQLGNHTHHHDDLSLLPAAQVGAAIGDAQDAIEQCAQVAVSVFRPPRGELPGNAAREAARHGMDVLMWSVTRDVSRVGTPASVVADLTGRISAGDVLGLHDGLGHAGFHPSSPMAQLLRRRRDVEVRALPHLLEELAGRHLRCVSVQELLAATPQAAVTSG